MWAASSMKASNFLFDRYDHAAPAGHVADGPFAEAHDVIPKPLPVTDLTPSAATKCRAGDLAGAATEVGGFGPPLRRGDNRKNRVIKDLQ